MKLYSDQKFTARASLLPIPTRLGQEIVTRYHYKGQPLHPLSRPFYYGVYWNEELVGVQGYCRTHFPRLGGLFAPYCGEHDCIEPVAGIAPPYSTWQVLVHGRGWISDRLLDGSPTPRNLESWAIRRALRPYNGHHVPMLVEDYLRRFPPRFPKQPWTIRAVLMWADLDVANTDWQGIVHRHTGTIYRAAGAEFFKLTVPKRRTRHGKAEAAGGPKKMFVIRLPEPPCWWQDDYIEWWKENYLPTAVPMLVVPPAAEQLELWAVATLGEEQHGSNLHYWLHQKAAARFRRYAT